MRLIKTNRIKDNNGQTLIETALVLILLLMILIGIAEYSRAWYRKSSVKNAVRQGARVAAVTPHIATTSASCGGGITCSPTLSPGLSTSCTGPGCNDGYIEAIVCCTTGVANDASTTVNITVTDSTGAAKSGDAQSGDAVNVSSTTAFSTIVPRLFGSLIPTQLSSDATMRYE